MTTDTVFDLASITKPVATATSIMVLIEQGRMRLQDRVAQYLPEFGQKGKEAITVEDLLLHQGGLIPDNPLADYLDGSEKAWQRVCALELRSEPGSEFVYSDVGFIVLGELVRRLAGQDVHQFSQAHIFGPLGMSDTGYLPAEPLRTRAAATEQREGRWLRGEVHDPRAHLLGGIAGHAGLFADSRRSGDLRSNDAGRRELQRNAHPQSTDCRHDDTCLCGVLRLAWAGVGQTYRIFVQPR